MEGEMKADSKGNFVEIDEVGPLGKLRLCRFEDVDEEDDAGEAGSVGDGGIFAGFQQGLATIRRYTRETLGNCPNEESWIDMKNRLESSTFGLLRAEKSALAMSMLAAETVDQYFECEDDDNDDEPIRPFCLRDQNMDEIRGIVDEMNKVFSVKMSEFSEGLTEQVLSTDHNFLALKKEINLAENDLKERGDGQLLQMTQGQEEEPDSDGQDKSNNNGDK